VVGGSFHSNLTIGSYSLFGGLGLFGDAFVAKFDNFGKPLWALAGTMGGGSNYVNGIATDSAGDIFAAGNFTATLDFDGGGVMSAGGADAFLVKLMPTGLVAWSKNFGDAGVQSTRAVAVDKTDSVIFAVASNSPIDLGGGSLGNMGGEDLYLAKYTNSGAYVWGKRYGDADDQSGLRVALDHNNNVILAGAFAGSIDLGGGTLVSLGQHDYFVAKLDANGKHIWSKRFGDANDDFVINVAVDESDNVLLSGSLVGTIDFGGGALISMGGDMNGGDVFVVKLDGAGDHLWSRRFGDSFPQSACGITSAGAGAAFVAGNFTGQLDFGGGSPLTNLGAGSIFLAKLLTP
jgi:hypothetical protein